jgi:quercetin dioxygenase-like cupin family protein
LFGDLAVTTPNFVREDARGLFVEILNGGGWETVIHGSMQTGAELGNHYHRDCNAFFYLLRGEAEVSVRQIDENSVRVAKLQAREGVWFKPLETHRIVFLADADFLLLKDKPFDKDAPDLHPCPVSPAEEQA